MGNCHSKSDDHHGRDGYSSSTEKLNPRPYQYPNNNPNVPINYTTKNKFIINVPAGQAGATAAMSQRQEFPRQQSQSQPQPQFQQPQLQQRQQQFSSPPKGKRRPANPKPEYYVHIKCRSCENPDRKGGPKRCATATDLNLQGPMAYRDPAYRGNTPRGTWDLEVDFFCESFADFLASERMHQTKKTPQEVLARFIRYVDFGPAPKPFAVDDLLQALDEGGVWKKSSL